MIGWRARFGVIIPSLNVTTEAEFYRCLPEGVTAHFTRMEFKDTTPGALETRRGLQVLAAMGDAYLALDEKGRASIRVYLTSLSREPKLFVP